MTDPTSVTAIVPLRTGGKTRLAPALRPEERSALAGAMLADVAHALHAAGLEHVVVAAQGPAAEAAAGALGLPLVADPQGRGLDRALLHAAARLTPTAGLLVVAADLPRLSADDVRALLAVAAPVVVAPTHDGGTGGLLRRPPDVIATAYGPGSADAHGRLAADAGVEASTLEAEGFARDVDTLADLGGLAHGPLGPATAEVVERFGLTRRAAG